jgi:hypothetical protein
MCSYLGIHFWLVESVLAWALAFLSCRIFFVAWGETFKKEIMCHGGTCLPIGLWSKIGPQNFAYMTLGMAKLPWQPWPNSHDFD